MKIMFSVFLMTVCLWQTFNAQSEIGLEVGPSRAAFWNDVISAHSIYGIKYVPMITYAGGISFQKNIKKNISFKLNFLIEKKGQIYTGYGNILSETNNMYWGAIKQYVNLNYITLPILIKETFGNKVIFFVNEGVFIAALMKQTSVFESQNTRIGSQMLYYRKIDVGITAGLGIAIPFKEKFSVTCEIRGNVGFVNLQKGYGVQTNYGSVYVKNGFLHTNSTNLLLGIAYSINSVKKSSDIK